MAGRGSAPGERRGGRQKGTPNKATAEVKTIAREYGREAIEKLVELMRGGSEQVQVSACKELLDRGYGKPSQAVDVKIEREVTDITDAELAAIAAAGSGRVAAPTNGAAGPDQLH